MIKRHLFSLILVLVIALTLCGPVVSADTSTTNAIHVRVGIYENNPKIFMDNGKPAGFWPEIVNYVATQEGWVIEWVPGTWTECLDRLQKNEIDIMPDVALTEERSLIYDFSNEGVYTSWSMIFERKGAEIQSLIDLEGKKLAVLQGSVNVEGAGGIKQLLTAFDVRCTLLEKDTYDAVLAAVQSGEADGGVTSKDFGFEHAAQYGLEETPILFQPSQLYFAFSKNAELTPYLIERVDYNVKAIKDDTGSIYYQALDQWISGSVVRTYEMPTWAISVIAGVAWVCLVAIVGVFLLRSRVNARTKALTQENTRRKQAEEKTRESEEFSSGLLRNIPHPMHVLDPDRRILFVNPALLKLTGFTEAELLGTKPPYPWWPEERRQESEQSFEQAVSGKASRFELQFRKKNGVLFWVAVNFSILEDNGTLLYYISAWTDITERKRTDEELAKYRDKLEDLVKIRTAELAEKTVELSLANEHLQEMDKLKSVFLASMSHELRTPLNSIIGFTGIMLMGMSGELNEEQKKQLTLIKNSSSHLLSLINDILDISKIEANRVELSPEEFQLKDLAKEVIDPMVIAANGKGVQLISNVPDSIPVYNDRRRMKQVLLNLVSNAVKFTEKGSVTIKASLSGENKIEIKVIDTGIGIKPDEMGKLFQPFQQVGASLTKKYEGTGLGLYLSSKLAGLMGGGLTAGSEYGKGSEFTFTLPLRKV